MSEKSTRAGGLYTRDVEGARYKLGAVGFNDDRLGAAAWQRLPLPIVSVGGGLHLGKKGNV